MNGQPLDFGAKRAPAILGGDGALAVGVLGAHGVQAGGVADGARDALHAVRVGVRRKLQRRGHPGECSVLQYIRLESWTVQTPRSQG